MKKIHVEKYKSLLVKRYKAISKDPYYRLMRLDKPIGFVLALLPALWALIFASRSLGTILLYLPLFVIGAILVRGAGCVINDIIDRDIDAKVSRTSKRPLAKGEISVQNAIKFVFLLLGLSFLLLLLLPLPAIIAGFVTIIPITVYPYMKRVTNFPQVFLGLTFNLGVFIGWLAINPRLSLEPVLLYITAACWTIGYDSMYAFQDKKDDARYGIKSLVVKFGENSTLVIWNFYKLVGLLFGILGILTHMNLFYYVFWAIAFYHLYWQTQTLEPEDPKNCAEKFESNVLFGILILVGALLGRL